MTDEQGSATSLERLRASEHVEPGRATSSSSHGGSNRPAARARVIAIANQKGGVGKTTTSTNLAAGLSALGKRVLLLDLDPQANASSGLGIAGDAYPLTIYEVVLGHGDAVEATIETGIDHLWMIPSTRRLVGAELELTSLDQREYRLRTALESIVPRYDFIVMDCPPSLGLLTLNALTAAQSILIPIQCEYYALEGLGSLMHTIRLVQGRLNPLLYLEGVLLTMYDSRLNLARQVADEARRYFGDRVYGTVIPRNVKTCEAPSFGKPVLTYDPKSSGAESYLSLAKEVMENDQARAGTRSGRSDPGERPGSQPGDGSVGDPSRQDHA